MKTFFKRLYCFFKGHDWINLYHLNNADVFDGVWQSAWGEYECTRCGLKKYWQYDRP